MKSSNGPEEHAARVKPESIRALVLFGAVPLYGQERENIRVFQGLSELGVKAKFLTNSAGGELAVEPELKRLGFPFARAPYGPRIGRESLTVSGLCSVLKGIVLTNLALIRAIRDFQPTHIHAMNPAYLVYASPAVFLCGIPLIYRIGDAPPVKSLPNRFLWRIMKRRVTKLVTVSDYISKLCIGNGFLAEKTIQIPPAVEASLGRTRQPVTLSVTHYEWPHRHEVVTIAPAPEVLTVVFSGQLAPAKGFDLLLTAVERLIRTGVKLRLLIAGDYSYERPQVLQLKQAVEEEGLSDRIMFLGYVNNVADLLSLADVHVCPSVWNEPFGITVLEAKREAIPSVIFPNGGLAESVDHGLDGWVCSDQTADGIAEALSFYAANPSERQAQGRAAAERVSGFAEFGWERFKREWLSVFTATVTPRPAE